MVVFYPLHWITEISGEMEEEWQYDCPTVLKMDKMDEHCSILWENG